MKPVREHLPSQVLAGRELDVPMFTGPLHMHRQWELTLLREGAGIRLVGDHVGTFAAGELLLLGPELPHAWISTPQLARRSRATVAHFAPSVAALIDQLPDPAPIRAMLGAASRGVFFPAAPDLPHDAMSKLATAPAIQPSLGALFTLLEQLSALRYAQLATQSRLAVSPTAQRRIDAVSAYVIENHRASIDMAVAARRASLTPQAFSRFFRTATGHTFTSYVTEVRLGTARTLLRETDLPITAVAQRAGFSNLANFNRQFRRHTGMTPSTYRRSSARC